MDGLGFPLLLFFLMVAAVILAVGERRRGRERIQASFDALIFQTPEGPQPGSAMRIVKTVIDRAGASEGGDGVNAAFWYCVGHGPSYFVAIAQPLGPFSFGGKRYRWVIRPLSADRMRGALLGDADALHAAFGDPPPLV